MPNKKKKVIKKQKTKSKSNTLNRYNIFQKELSSYIRETGGSGSDFKKYRKLYKDLDASIPIKRIGDSIPALILKQKTSNEGVKFDYGERFPFYQAKGEFSLPKYVKTVLNVKFDDGGLKLDWTGTVFDFMGWFSGDIIAYFRNNYNDSPTAEFVLKNVNGNVLEYEIEVQGSAWGTSGYIPPDKEIVIKDKKFRDVKDAENQQRMIEFIDRKAKLIGELKSIGYSNDEIRAEIRKIDESFYGKKG
jgi:hypothetical protein